MGFFFGVLVLAVLVCGGLTAASQPDGLLHPIRAWLRSRVERKLLSKFIAYPLLLCDTCMSSVWGSVTYWCVMAAFHVEPSWEIVAMWPILVLGCAVCNYFLWTLISTVEAVRDYFQWKLNFLKKSYNDGKPR